MEVFKRKIWLKSSRSLLTLTAIGLCQPALAAGPGDIESAYPSMEELTLETYMQRVVDFNQAVQSKLLAFHAARRQRMAEMGTFEPSLVTGANYSDRRWPQTDIDERNQGFATAAIQAIINEEDPPPNDLYPYIGEERNRRYSTDIEMLTPIGTRVRVGARADDIRRNFAPAPGYDSLFSGYSTSIGITVEQPLLRGLGFASNLASLRLAAHESEIAFQAYRRQLMQVISAAEMAYWRLYYAQQEYALSKESVALAETLLRDSEASFEAGRGAELDVLEAKAGLAIRKSRQSDARLKCIEAINELASFFGGVPKTSGTGYIAVQSPESEPVDLAFGQGMELAMAMNPDLQRAKLEKEQARVRFEYAKNQRLPELNLTTGVDFAGQGVDWSGSNADIEDLSFPGWSVGLVFRVPMWGDVRKRNELWAAKLRYREAERNESDLMTQLKVGSDTAEHRLDANYTTAQSLEEVVDFRDNLLQTRMQSRDVGRMDTRSVLEAEQELFVARLEQLQSEVECQRASLELQLISGTLLQMRDLDITFEYLEGAISEWSGDDPRKMPDMIYRPADISRLPNLEPVDFGGDPARAPWMGLSWGNHRGSE